MPVLPAQHIIYTCWQRANNHQLERQYELLHLCQYQYDINAEVLLFVFLIYYFCIRVKL